MLVCDDHCHRMFEGLGIDLINSRVVCFRRLIREDDLVVITAMTVTKTTTRLAIFMLDLVLTKSREEDNEVHAFEYRGLRWD